MHLPRNKPPFKHICQLNSLPESQLTPKNLHKKPDNSLLGKRQGNKVLVFQTVSFLV